MHNCQKWSFWCIIVNHVTFVIVMVNDHGVIILVMKRNPILGLYKPVPIIIITGILEELHYYLNYIIIIEQGKNGEVDTKNECL